MILLILFLQQKRDDETVPPQITHVSAAAKPGANVQL